MFRPAVHTENETLVGYLDQQLTGIRAAAFGLDDAQARETPCRSSLSIGGLIKHTTHVLKGRNRRRANPTAAPDEAGFAQFVDSFALRQDETLEGALAAFDAAREAYLADIRATDAGTVITTPPAPWDGIYEPSQTVERFELVHHIEELARHAGHADIIREQLDGASAASLLMAYEGREGNDFIQPWTPAVKV